MLIFDVPAKNNRYIIGHGIDTYSVRVRTSPSVEPRGEPWLRVWPGPAFEAAISAGLVFQPLLVTGGSPDELDWAGKS